MGNKARIRFLPGGLVLITRGMEYEYFTSGEGDIIAAVMSRPVIFQDILEAALWPPGTTIPLDKNSSRNTRMVVLNKKLARFGVKIEGEFGGSDFMHYRLVHL